MKVDTKRYAIALYELAAQTPPAGMKPMLANFAKLLAKKRLIGQWPNIARDFVEYYNRQQNIATVRVTSAKVMAASERDELIKKLEEITKKKVELQPAVDPEILGGLIIKINDSLYDGSLRAKLAGLKKKLTI